MNVVPDTNFMLSGFLWDGNPKHGIILAEKKKIRLCGTGKTYKEFCRVISYPKFFHTIKSLRFSPQRLILNYLRLVAFFPEINYRKPIVEDDPDDDIFVHAALSSQSRIIVSGDKHLLKLKEVMGIYIVNPTELLKLIELLEEKKKPSLTHFPKHPRLATIGEPMEGTGN
ncbi:MAG: putative toxin-antitoxin system toxin component, PIN family [Candidatus Bathyarchaeia archaeon]